MQLQKPTPHKLRDFFKGHRVTQLAIAQTIKIPRGTLGNWLNGYSLPPPKVDRLLHDLARQIEEEEKKI